MKKITLLFAMIFSVMLLHAQNEKPSTDDSDLKHEIGIDMKGLFNGFPGGALIYKVRDKKQPTVGNYVKNRRYQLSVWGGLSLADNTTQENTSSNIITEEESGSNLFIHPQIGIERVRMFDRFGLYYGADTGPFYRHNSQGYNAYYYKNQNNQSETVLARTKKTNEFGWSFTPFFGMKYKLNKRFSLAMETGLSVSYSFIQSSNFSVRANQDIFTKKLDSRNQNHKLVTDMNFLRFMTFNYHF